MASAEKKEEAAAPEATADAAAPAPGGSNKLVMILSLVNVVATLGMIGLLYTSSKKEQNKPKVEDIDSHEGGEEHAEGGGEHGGGEKAAGGEHGAAKGGEHGGGGGLLKKKPEFGKMVTLEQFTINLSAAGSNSPRFVRVNISLEVPTDDAEAELGAKSPQVRNTIIDLFNSKRLSDLSTAEGRDFLKDEIKNAINGFMVTGKVKGVFFTNFAFTS